MIIGFVMILRDMKPSNVNDSDRGTGAIAYDAGMKRAVVFVAWVLAVLVVAFTLGPLSDRPQFGHPQIERFLAFLALGLCWAAAYPARPWRVLIGLVAAVILLEAAQGVVPGRDPAVPDALAKIAGATTATALLAAARWGLRRRAWSSPEAPPQPGR
jgi:peptidoglycan/LPS O-acetylase OafA/YrhL